MVTRFWFFAFFQVFFVSNAAALSVFIRTGSYQIGTESVYKTTIRQDSLHDITPTPYYLSQSTFLQITIHNLDTVLHELAWNDQVSGVVVPALGNVTITRNITGSKYSHSFVTTFQENF